MQQVIGVLYAHKPAERESGYDIPVAIANWNADAAAVFRRLLVVKRVAGLCDLAQFLPEHFRVRDRILRQRHHFAGVDDLLRKADRQLGKQDFTARACIKG
ncbi:hypothetical protein SDC9_181837 [bioreactor metagenome]|uniref:Uncharacterized protein n=1 Tax=bioreactor metagenome TaxID=1076179 RepID=A0A645HE17_9ZZZZ